MVTFLTISLHDKRCIHVCKLTTKYILNSSLIFSYSIVLLCIADLHNFMQLCMFLPYQNRKFLIHRIKLITIYTARKTEFRYNITLTYLLLSAPTHNSQYYIRNSGKYTFYFSNLIKCLSETHQPLLSNTIYLAHIQDSIKMLVCNIFHIKVT